MTLQELRDFVNRLPRDMDKVQVQVLRERPRTRIRYPVAAVIWETDERNRLSVTRVFLQVNESDERKEDR